MLNMYYMQWGDFCGFITPSGFFIKVHTVAVICLSGSLHQITQPGIHA